MSEESQTAQSLSAPAATPVRQHSIYMENRVGALSSLVRWLRDYHIEVLGLSVQDSSELTLARLILSDPDTAETLFMEKGIAHVLVDVIVVELEESGRDLSHCLATLLAVEVNIHFLYPLLVRPGFRSLIVIQTDDLEVSRDALNRAGFRLIAQQDLSR